MKEPELPKVKAAIRSIPDFPVPGILFRDITPRLHDPRLFQQTVDALTEYARSRGAEVIAGIESRGFIFGTPAEVDVDISGADRLRLVVTDAGDNIYSDCAVWADAKIQ